MKVDYTLPGLLPEPTTEPPLQLGEIPEEPFGEQLRRLRAPSITDWREVLRLNTSPNNAGGLAPPPIPGGLESRDGAQQRAWWRTMLHKQSTQATAGSSIAVQHMLRFLQESQQLEERIFARHFAEDEA